MKLDYYRRKQWEEKKTDKTFEFWEKSQTFRKIELIGSKEEKVAC